MGQSYIIRSKNSAWAFFPNQPPKPLLFVVEIKNSYLCASKSGAEQQPIVRNWPRFAFEQQSVIIKSIGSKHQQFINAKHPKRNK